MSIKPLSDRVVVRDDDPEFVSAGGVVIPDGAAERPLSGVVLAVGPGLADADGGARALVVGVGDRVLFTGYAGSVVEHGGEAYRILREGEILASV